MSQKITDFVSRFQGGYRPNLFRVLMQSGQVAGQNFTQDNFSFLCKAAQIPAETIGNIQVPFMGRQIAVPGDRTFADWTITIINDEDFAVRTVFEAWSQGINQHELNTTTAQSFGQYYGSGLVQALSRNGQIIREYEIIQCYPTEIAAMDLAFDSNDTISEFTITLSYNFFALKGQGDSLPGPSDNSGVAQGTVPSTGIIV